MNLLAFAVSAVLLYIAFLEVWRRIVEDPPWLLFVAIALLLGGILLIRKLAVRPTAVFHPDRPIRHDLRAFVASAGVGSSLGTRPAYSAPHSISRTKALRKRKRSNRKGSAIVSEGILDDEIPRRGLVILGEHLRKILSGSKTMELRTRPNRQLGPIALIQKGSGKIFGVARIVGSVGPMSFSEFVSRSSEHCVKRGRDRNVFDNGYVHGWQLAQVRVLATPVSYVHKGMSQVKLDDHAINELRIQLLRKSRMNGFVKR